MCIMASNHVVAFVALDKDLFTPMLFCLLRYLVTAPVLIAMHMPHIRDPKIERAPMKDILTQSVLMFAANHSFLYYGNKHAGALLSSAMQPAVPIVTALLAFAFGMETFNMQQAMGTVLAAMGVMMLLDISQIDLANSKSLGVLALIAQVFSNAFALIFLKKTMNKYEHATYFTAQAMCGASVIMLFITSLTGDLQHLLLTWQNVPFSGWMAIGYCGVIVIGGGQVMHNWAVKYLNASTCALYYMLQVRFRFHFQVVRVVNLSCTSCFPSAACIWRFSCSVLLGESFCVARTYGLYNHFDWPCSQCSCYPSRCYRGCREDGVC
jgi:drug/metabolite transporter (DMT)-like permease